jgi:hypothetical protein
METLTAPNSTHPPPASGLTSHLYITLGFATTPPTLMESEAGLRGRPAVEAPNKKIPQHGETLNFNPCKNVEKGGILMCCYVK